MEILDFTKNKIQAMELSDLKRTFKEKNINGEPLRGMYHYDLIDNINSIIQNSGYRSEVKEIFAANGGGRDNPSVTISEKEEMTYGKNAIEAHLLRRVYANIDIYDFDNDELSTRVAIAWHQKGIQIAYGRMVKVCHNLCIMNASRILSTARDMTIYGILDKFSSFMNSLEEDINYDDSLINKMKRYEMSASQVLCTIGTLTTMRVAHDTLNPEIRDNRQYPLNQSQISQFTEDLLVLMKKNDVITLWDLYNTGTNLLKADKMDIPALIPQHIALTDFARTFINN